MDMNYLRKLHLTKFLSILNCMEQNWMNKNQCSIGCTGCRKIFRRFLLWPLLGFLVALENNFIFSQYFHQKLPVKIMIAKLKNAVKSINPIMDVAECWVHILGCLEKFLDKLPSQWSLPWPLWSPYSAVYFPQYLTNFQLDNSFIFIVFTYCLYTHTPPITRIKFHKSRDICFNWGNPSGTVASTQ